MMLDLADPNDWQLSPATVVDLVPEDELATQKQRLATKLVVDSAMRERYLLEFTLSSGRITTALHAPGSASDYLGLDVLGLVDDVTLRRQLLQEVVLAPSILLPLDLRAAALEHLLPIMDAPQRLTTMWKRTAPQFDALPRVDLLRRDTDGVDHVYDVPVDPTRFIDLLVGAAEVVQVDRVGRLLDRVAGIATTNVGSSSPELEAAIDANLRTALLKPADFIVEWDQVVGVDVSGSPLTIAEIAKALLVHPLARLPERALRRATVGFYRAVLGVGGRSIVGLGAGFLYVEHGLTADPSYVFVGQDAIIGKGVTLDTVGGVVLGRESFIGGGFLPVLIHTHKHLRADGSSAVSERKHISRTAFVAERGARFPMSEIGLFECADHLDRPEVFPGIRVVKVQEIR